jgi:hypothetical protein
MDIYTFENYWSAYHYQTKQKKPGNKPEAKMLWDDCNFNYRKKKAFFNIKKYVGRGMSALEVLKIELNKF